MAKLTLIEGGGKGGGPTDPGGQTTRHVLRQLVIEILRAVARGNDSEGRIATPLRRLIEVAPTAKTPLASIVDDVLQDFAKRITPDRAEDFGPIVIQSLRVAAETCCDDSAAQGRMSRREDDLRHAIESYVRTQERRARENGWSYVSQLTEHLRPPTKPRR
jgi:hypothetical protein